MLQQEPVTHMEARLTAKTRRREREFGSKRFRAAGRYPSFAVAHSVCTYTHTHSIASWFLYVYTHPLCPTPTHKYTYTTHTHTHTPHTHAHSTHTHTHTHTAHTHTHTAHTHTQHTHTHTQYTLVTWLLSGLSKNKKTTRVGHVTGARDGCGPGQTDHSPRRRTTLSWSKLFMISASLMNSCRVSGV